MTKRLPELGLSRGGITAEQALGQLAYKKVNHQVAILNQRIVDECLRFRGSEGIPDAQ